MENILSNIIKRQLEEQHLVDKHGYVFRDTKDLVSSYMSAIVGETVECNQEVGFKWWKKPDVIDYEALYKEVADIFIFWLDLCIRLGVEDRIFNIIYEKQLENIKRQQGKVKGREDYKA